MEKDVLSCKNPAQHGDKWLLQASNERSEVLPCFACCTISLENKQELCLRKRMILSFLRDFMESKAQILINILSCDNQIVLHTAQVFLDILSSGDEKLLKICGECLLLFLIHMKKDGLGLTVMHRLTVEIQEERNYIRCLPHFHVLGRLFQLFPEITGKGTCTNSKFLHVLAIGLSYPSDEVKSAILFLLRQIYQNVEKNKVISRSFDKTFVKSILRTIKCSQNKDMIKHALGLLQVFTSKVLHNTSILFENSPEEVSFTDVIKKVILSNESSFQVSIVQCICQLLSNSSFQKQTMLLLQANIPELLFDVLSVKNELLLESILCCLMLFVNNSESAAKSHLVFGIGVIIEVCFPLLVLKNWKLLYAALNLLTAIVTNNEYLLISSHMAFYYQSIQLTEKTLKVQNQTILLAVCNFFNAFLKNKDIPWALPLEQIYKNMNLFLKSVTKVISVLIASEHVKKHLGTLGALSTEMKLIIGSSDIISSCLRLCNLYSSLPVSVKKGFTSPNVQINNDSTSSSKENSSKNLVIMCLAFLDEILVPCCLQLKSTEVSGIAWYHLIQVLAVIYEGIPNIDLIYQFAQKLIKAGFLKFLFDMKANKVMLGECNIEDFRKTCNLFLKKLLVCALKTENQSDTYLKVLDDGLADLNDSLEDCASLLSQKCEVSERRSNEFWPSPSQITFLCLCYFSYLNEAYVVNPRILIPHLIFFVTCNSECLSSSNIIMKHIVFLMAVCTYECVLRKLKFQAALMEANMIIWDLLTKIKPSMQVYTHHKYVLWWCFKNEACNVFGSEVMLIWLTFCVDETQNFRNYAMKTVVSLLCASQSAQHTFVLLFDVSSPSSNETVIKFLKEAYNSEASEETYKRIFQDLIISMVHHVNSLLIKLFVLKNENDASLDKILCQGLDCLLWCHKQTNSLEMNTKILYHISRYCFLTNAKSIDTIKACIIFLQFTLKNEKDFEKAWYVMTGDHNFPSFFYKCFSSHTQLEVEALCLLVTFFKIQINSNLKSSIKIRLFPKQIMMWLNSSITQVFTYQLLNLCIKTEFQDTFIVFISLEYEDMLQNQHLHYRLFSLYLQNSIASGNPLYQDECIDSFLKFLTIISEKFKCLESHIMLLPWIKILMETRLENLDSYTLKLFEKWLNYKVNPSLIGIMQQFSVKLQNIDPKTELLKSCMKKLCTGPYCIFISNEIRNSFKKQTEEKLEITEESDLVSQVQKIVSDYITN